MSAFETPIAEYVALEKISDNEFVSLRNPGALGNTQLIAYGGCTLGIGVSAACQTVDPKYHLYSANGNYLGPAQIDRKYFCKVTRIRDTRTFATRLVEVSQQLDNGTKRLCMTMLADFQVAEPATMLEFSNTTRHPVPPPEMCIPLNDYRQHLVREKGVPQKIADMHKKAFMLMSSNFETREDPNSMLDQTLWGNANHLPTSQDTLPITSRTTTHWLRSIGPPLKTQAENVSALAFNIDGALSFIPLIHNHQGLQDAGACSSLDFAIRYFSNAIDLSQWHLKELQTHHGSNGRTYSEARLWDQQGNMVATMTQMNILRPKPEKKPKAAL